VQVHDLAEDDVSGADPGRAVQGALQRGTGLLQPGDLHSNAVGRCQVELTQFVDVSVHVGGGGHGLRH
jgi:hypothetical protein